MLSKVTLHRNINLTRSRGWNHFGYTTTEASASGNRTKGATHITDINYTIANVTPKVSISGLLRIREKQSREVVAWLVGDEIPNRQPNLDKPISLNPYVDNQFVDAITRKPINFPLAAVVATPQGLFEAL